MTAWWERPEPERPAWRTRQGHTYRPGDPFVFNAMGVGKWTGVVLEIAPNGWLRIRIDTATGAFDGMAGRVMAGPLWGLEPEK